jgi:hypothetical protein
MRSGWALNTSGDLSAPYAQVVGLEQVTAQNMLAQAARQLTQTLIDKRKNSISQYLMRKASV